MIIEPIAHIRTDFPSKFGLPRQSGRVDEICGRIVFESAYANPDAVRGLEGFSHIWLIWEFSMAVRDGWSATVRPPRLGGNTRIGVFASRSPFRPNRLGLSCVRLEGIDYDDNLGPVLRVSGVDMVDGTPIYDIKPYVPHADMRPNAIGGFADGAAGYRLNVVFPEELISIIPEEKRAALIGALAEDPRPSYQNDPDRVYGFAYAGFDVRFSVTDDMLTVREIVRL